MKLQYLGDARDAFKWDLLHWICTMSPFSRLVFVPLLTPDAKDSNEGKISHQRFLCQDFIRPFLDSLREEPRSLAKIAGLGTVHHENHFPVSVFAPERVIGIGPARREYWNNFDVSGFENSVVFFDPDNGYETQTQRGPKWIRHDELKSLFARLPETSVVLVYQHRPRRTWTDRFTELIGKLDYVHTAVAVHIHDLAFVAMAGNAIAGREIAAALTGYADRHPAVVCTSLISEEDSVPILGQAQDDRV